MRQTIYLIFEDVEATVFMRHTGVFESGKFVGRIEAISGVVKTSPREILAAWSERGPYRLVGVIASGTSAFAPDRTVYSDGEMWTTVEDLCKWLGAM